MYRDVKYHEDHDDDERVIEEIRLHRAHVELIDRQLVKTTT